MNATMSDFTDLVDLACERLGGKAIIANDEFFAPKENLLKPGRGEFIEGKFTDRGKWMDGWETRRRRTPGHDWCIIRLGLPGIIRGLVVDTNHFKGNHPESCSIEACELLDDCSAEALAGPQIHWREVLPRSPLRGHSENPFAISEGHRVTHIRLNIFPDGGVARLRVFGEVGPDLAALRASKEPVDLVAIENGGSVLTCSDMFFGPRHNLIMPGRAVNMGDGWETKRRRGPGYDWVILQLAARGAIQKIEVDTNHFKGNYPDSCSIEQIDAMGQPLQWLTSSEANWITVLPQLKLQAHTRHFFEKELITNAPCTHARLNIYPDGGVSRLRLFGKLAEGQTSR